MSFIKYIADESHYKEVLSLVEKAKRTVWIGFSHDTNIRIDTHRDKTMVSTNRQIMQHNILKQGFTYCGIIYLQSGDALDQRSLATKGTQERLAYQKMVSH